MSTVQEAPRGTGSGPTGEEHGRRLSRRMLIRLGLAGTLALFLLEVLGTFLDFYTPRKYGTFGSKVTLGKPSQYAMPSITTVIDAKLFLSHVPEGFLAMYWKCPHLGCTVQWHPEEQTEDKLAPQGRFHCPCHGSIYNRYGQIVFGPAPRPLDLFTMSLSNGNLVADTGDITQRPKWEPSQAFKA